MNSFNYYFKQVKQVSVCRVLATIAGIAVGLTALTAGATVPALAVNALEDDPVFPQPAVAANGGVLGDFTRVSETDSDITYNFKRAKTAGPVKNPFPDVISDAEIEKAFKHGDVSLLKMLFTPAPTADDPHPQARLVKKYEMPAQKGTYKLYAVFKFEDYAYPTGLFTRPSQTRDGLPLRDGSIYAGSSETVKYVDHPVTVKANGVTLASETMERVLIDIKEKSPANIFYLEFTWQITKEPERVLFNAGTSIVSGGYTYTFWYAEFGVMTDAQFHAVDDLQYRRATRLALHATLPQRGNSDTHPLLSEAEKTKTTILSSCPFYEIPSLAPLQGLPTLTTEKTDFLRSTGGDVKTPMLTYDGDDKQKSCKRPTMAELTSRSTPGYVYWDNDLDKPNNATHEFKNDSATKETPGNHYLSFAYAVDKNGQPLKRLTRKHYYLTYRALPTQLAVEYKKNDGSYEIGKPFELRANNAVIQGKFSSMQAGKDPTRQELIEMMRANSTTLIAPDLGYAATTGTYLLPGKYTVKPLLKAPAGYEWVADGQSEPSFAIELQKTSQAKTQKIITFKLQKKQRAYFPPIVPPCPSCPPGSPCPALTAAPSSSGSVPNAQVAHKGATDSMAQQTVGIVKTGEAFNYFPELGAVTALAVLTAEIRRWRQRFDGRKHVVKTGRGRR